MLSIWIIHRDAKARAALARISGVDERAVLASPTDRVLENAEAPTVVVLGLSGDFEVELDFVYRHATKLAHCSWILLPAAHDVEEATRLFDTLAAEVLAYPPDPRALRRALRAAIRRRHADPLSVRQGRAEIQTRFMRWFGDLDLPELMRALDPRLARVPLLIHGEQGTGRGLLARYVHAFAGHPDHNLVHIACRGDSATGDLLRQLVHGARRGPSDVLTVCFEDVDRLPTSVQRSVRDWIEFGLPESGVRRHGHRFMASASSASDLDLEPGLDARLGETLSGLTIALPPLRERAEHVPTFAQETAAAFAVAHGERVRHFGDAALAKLAAYPWPGNLHELEAVVMRTLAFTSADPIAPIHLRFPSDVHWLGEPLLRADLEPEAPERTAPRPQPEARNQPAQPSSETRAADLAGAAVVERRQVAIATEVEDEEEALEAEIFDLERELEEEIESALEDLADLDLGRVASLGDAPVAEETLATGYALSDEEEESLFPVDDLDGENEEGGEGEEEGGEGVESDDFDAEAHLPEAVFVGTDDEVAAPSVIAGDAETVAEVELIEDPEVSAAFAGLDDPGDVTLQELLPDQEALDPPVRPLPEAPAHAPSAESMALDALPFDQRVAAKQTRDDDDVASRHAASDPAGDAIDGPLGPVHPPVQPAAANHVDARLQQLIGAIAHEVRNPLVSIRTFSELLPDHYDDPEFRTHFRELVVKDVERIDRVIGRLQTLAEYGGKTETVNVARLLDRVLDERRSTIQSRRLLVLKELDHASPLVHADPDQLEDALAGLLDRAIDQASERGDVYLASKYNAHGPDGHPTMRVLIRHTRASRGERPAGGSGPAEMLLDLVLAQRLIEVQGGRLTVDDAEANESVILVDLPAP